eukprot:6031403-Prymnesium_polylepis.2
MALLAAAREPNNLSSEPPTHPHGGPVHEPRRWLAHRTAVEVPVVVHVAEVGEREQICTRLPVAAK